MIVVMDYAEIRKITKDLTHTEITMWLYAKELKTKGISINDFSPEEIADTLKISKDLVYSGISKLNARGLI